MLRQQQQQQQLQQQQTTTISRRNHSANYQLTWQFGSNIFYSCCVWNIISCDNTIMCHAPEPTSLVWRQPSWTVVWQDKRGISKLGLWNSLCTTEPTLLEVIKWLSKVHYAHIQLDDASLSNIVYWGMKSQDWECWCLPHSLQPTISTSTDQSQSRLWHQVDLLRYRVNHSIFYTSH